MAIVIKEIKVVTTVEKSQVKEPVVSPEWIRKVNKLLNENKQQTGEELQKRER